MLTCGCAFSVSRRGWEVEGGGDKNGAASQAKGLWVREAENDYGSYRLFKPYGVLAYGQIALASKSPVALNNPLGL